MIQDDHYHGSNAMLSGSVDQCVELRPGDTLVSIEGGWCSVGAGSTDRAPWQSSFSGYYGARPIVSFDESIPKAYDNPASDRM